MLTATMPFADLESRLEAFRDEHAVICQKALSLDPADYVLVHKHEPMATLAGQALIVIRKLLEQNGHLVETMKHRIVVALAEAKAPVWEATHQHYKGVLYRMTGIRWDAEHEELVELVEYDDEKGKKFCITKRKWDSLLESGKPRYQYLHYKGAEAHGD